MRFKLLLLDEQPASLGAEMLLQTDNPADIAALRGAISGLASKPNASFSIGKVSTAGAKGREVFVQENDRSHPEISIRAGDKFPSAQAASAALGSAYNVVSYALKKASLAQPPSKT